MEITKIEEKIFKIIQSCQTRQHLEVAEKYIFLASKFMNISSGIMQAFYQKTQNTPV